MREKLNFGRDWLFHRGELKESYPPYKGFSYMSAKTERMHMGPASKDYIARPNNRDENTLHHPDKWISVNLPHDYIVGGEVSEDNNNALGFFEYDNAWYIKKFRLDDSDRNRRISLYFEGVATKATVYLNGCLLHHSFTGYTPFEVDITDTVRFGEENHLAVYVNTEEHEGWWYEGGGIYRPVWLCKSATVSVDLDGLYAKPVFKDGSWHVETELTLRNDTASSCSPTVRGRIFDADGKLVAEAQAAATVAEKDKAAIAYRFSVTSPHLWSPDDGYLYSMTAEIKLNGEIIDNQTIQFGFRTVKIDPNEGLFINDKHYLIKGVCGHADCGLFGKAVPDNIHRYKVQLMKEMGCNGYRTSHYPQSEVLMTELDKAGFIVMDETRWFESSPEGIAQLEALIKRDRNHPSVIFWSVGNEETYHTREQGKRICETLMAKLKKLDDSRFVMTAVDRPLVSTVYSLNDVIGINYNLGSYDKVHETFPDKAVFASECCATATTRGHYFDHDPNRGYYPAYDNMEESYFMGREKTWKFLTSRPWILGCYQWIAFEHRGEAIWPRLCSQSGAIDLYMQKKDAFYQNQSHFSEKPMVHLLPHWNWQGFEGQPISVWGYTNCEELELFLNGESLGKKTIEKYGHGEWTVPYTPGTLEIKAYLCGKIVATDSQITSGKPYRLRLTQDTLDVTDNGQDVALFTCSVEDENGNPVPNANISSVSFFTEGDCRVLSTGSDISDHKTVFSPDRRMREGRITVAVTLGTAPTAMRLYATSEDLLPAAVHIHTV